MAFDTGWLVTPMPVRQGNVVVYTHFKRFGSRTDGMRVGTVEKGISAKVDTAY